MAKSNKKQGTTIEGKFPWYPILAILALTIVAYLPSLSNGTVFWDDPEYVLNNPFTKKIEWGKMFSAFYMGNYHPLTLLSYAIEYKLFGENIRMFHINNLLIHLANTLLVFAFIHELFNKKQVAIATIVAALFAIHPMHVESVAWLSERKDVLYTFFYLLAMLLYVRYVQQGRKIKLLVYCFIASLLSLLAKGQAVSLPLIFILIDLFYEKQNFKNRIVEKIPFFILAFIFAYVAIKAQGAEKAINDNYSVGLSSLFFASYGVLLYMYKLFAPIHLSGLHPYPFSENMQVPGFVYLSALVPLTLLFIALKTYKKHILITVGILFFLVSIAPMLKLVPVGDTIIGERYTYIPYIGLFMIIGYLYSLTDHSEFKKYAMPGKIGLGIAIVLFCIGTYARTKVWKDSSTFWGNVVEQYPNYWRGNHCLGMDYYEKGNYQKAYECYSNAINQDKYCPPIPYLWRGATLLDKLNKPAESIKDFERVVQLAHSKQEQIYQEAMLNMGLAYYRMGNHQQAMKTYDDLMQVIPNDPKLYYNRGLVFAAAQQFDKALAEYEHAIQLNPSYTEPLLNRGVVYTDNLNQYDKGIADFNAVLALQPNNIDAIVNIGVALYKKGDPNSAIQQYNKALSLNPNNARVYYLRALSDAALQKYSDAVNDAKQAGSMGINIDQTVLNSWLAAAAKK